MPKYTVVGTRIETRAEATQDSWFAAQVLAAPAKLEEAARLIIGLVTTLLGLLLGVLALAGDKTPAFLRAADIKGLGLVAILMLFVALAAGLLVVVPWREVANSARPSSQAAVFDKILRRKSAALTVSAVAFGVSQLALCVVLALAIARAP